MFPNFGKCLSETSAHGIPRAAATENVRQRILWIVLFLGVTGIFAAHSLSLINQFLDEPTSVTIRPNAVNFQVPDIHMCNEIVFSNSYILKPDAERADALKQISELSQKLSPPSNYDMNNFPGVFWQTFPTHLLFEAYGQRNYQSIISIKNNEEQLINVEETLPHWRHLNCFRLRPNQSAFNTPEKQLTIYLFTDSSHVKKSFSIFGDIPITFMKFYDRPDWDKSSGFVVYFTPKGQYPSADTPKVVATPGYMTSVSLAMKRQELLNKKSSSCTVEKSNATYMNILKKQPATITYENAGYEACVNENIHKLTMTNCGCITHYFPITPEMLARNLPQCFNLTQLAEEFNYNITNINKKLENLKYCVDNQRNNLTIAINACQKKWPCHRDWYSVSSTSSLSFLSDTLGFFILTVLHSSYSELQQRNKSVPGWTPYMLLDSQSLKLAPENFAKLVIHSTEITSSLIVEEKTYFLRNLLSDIGGILGFYLGISVLTICEIFSVILDVIENCALRGHQKNVIHRMEANIKPAEEDTKL